MFLTKVATQAPRAPPCSRAPQKCPVDQLLPGIRMTVWRYQTVMLRALVLALLLSFEGFAQQGIETKAKTQAEAAREAGLDKANETQELRHFELHHFFIPVTQGNLQWLTSRIGARPEEALVVWKLMRGWDANRAQQRRDQGERHDTIRNPT